MFYPVSHLGFTGPIGLDQGVWSVTMDNHVANVGTRTLSGLEPLLKLFESLSPVMLWVFLGGLALGAALLLYFLLRELFYSRMPGRRKGGAAAEEPDWRPSEAAARTLLEDADALAAEGRFEEAVHLLLFRSIEDIAQRKPGLVRPALTSRDLARAPRPIRVGRPGPRRRRRYRRLHARFGRGDGEAPRHDRGDHLHGRRQRLSGRECRELPRLLRADLGPAPRPNAACARKP
jgi:hypothetical protein